MKLRTKTFNKYGEKYQIKYHEFTDKSGDNMISYTITDGEYDTFSNRWVFLHRGLIERTTSKTIGDIIEEY